MELTLLNLEWDTNNPLLAGLDRPAGSDEERQVRAEELGPRLWHAQHAGQVRAAGEASFLVFVWNLTAPGEPMTSFQVTKDRQIVVTTAEDVTGTVTPTKLEGYGEPQVYRVRTNGVATSIIFPWSSLQGKPYVIVCREGHHGVYPDTINAKQGHAISPETWAWYQTVEGDDRFRILVPFLSVDSS